MVGTSVGLFGTANLDGQNTLWKQIGKNTIGNVVIETLTYRPVDGRLVVATHGNGIYQTNLNNVNNVLAIENSGSFNGKYFVLMGRLSPIDGVTPQDLGIPKLIERIKSSDIDEIIIATSPTIEGDATSFYIKDQLNDNNILISRIAYGVPMGGELEYVDNTTLGRAIQGRREIN